MMTHPSLPPLFPDGTNAQYYYGAPSAAAPLQLPQPQVAPPPPPSSLLLPCGQSIPAPVAFLPNHSFQAKYVHDFGATLSIPAVPNDPVGIPKDYLPTRKKKQWEDHAKNVLGETALPHQIDKWISISQLFEIDYKSLFWGRREYHIIERAKLFGIKGLCGVRLSSFQSLLNVYEVCPELAPFILFSLDNHNNGFNERVVVSEIMKSYNFVYIPGKKGKGFVERAGNASAYHKFEKMVTNVAKDKHGMENMKMIKRSLSTNPQFALSAAPPPMLSFGTFL